MTSFPRRTLTTFGCLIALLVGCAQNPPLTTTAGTTTTSTARALPTGASVTARPSGPTGTASATPPGTTPPAEAVDCTRLRCVALTIDDGPGPMTGTLLDILSKNHVPATFFLVGQMVQRHRLMARRIANTPGMTVANHTMTHPMLTRISATRASAEITQDTRLIQQVTGVRVRFFRPPYGLHNRATDAVARKLGQAVVVWSAGALDWQYDTPSKIVQVTLPQISAGSIVLAHDIHPWTIKAVPTLIAKLRAKGYILVSLDDILGNTRPGATYARGRH